MQFCSVIHCKYHTENFERVEETQEAMSTHSNASSYNATAPVCEGETADTASSVRNIAEPLVMVQHVRMGERPNPPAPVMPIAPNTAYSERAVTQQSRSVSP